MTTMRIDLHGATPDELRAASRALFAACAEAQFHLDKLASLREAITREEENLVTLTHQHEDVQQRVRANVDKLAAMDDFRATLREAARLFKD